MIDIGLVTLSLDELPGDQVFLGNLAVGGNFVCCLIIVVIFIGLGNVLGKVYRLEMGGAGGGVEILKLSYWGKATKDGTIFMGKVDPSRHHVNILIWQLEEG